MVLGVSKSVKSVSPSSKKGPGRVKNREKCITVVKKGSWECGPRAWNSSASRVTAEVTARVTAGVTAEVTAEATAEVTAEV